MGTKAKCIKCGSEHWINTGKLKEIHETFGIRPCVWLKTKYICRNCKHLTAHIKKSSMASIESNINDFILKCKYIYSGTYLNPRIKNKTEELKRKIKEAFLSIGIQDYKFITYKKTIIGMEISIPIINSFSFFFVG